MVKVHTTAGSHGRVRYDAGDLEVAVEWFMRDVSGGDERRIFKAWTGNGEAGVGQPIAGHKTLSTQLS